MPSKKARPTVCRAGLRRVVGSPGGVSSGLGSSSFQAIESPPDPGRFSSRLWFGCWGSATTPTRSRTRRPTRSETPAAQVPTGLRRRPRGRRVVLPSGGACRSRAQAHRPTRREAGPGCASTRLASASWACVPERAGLNGRARKGDVALHVERCWTRPRLFTDWIGSDVSTTLRLDRSPLTFFFSFFPVMVDVDGTETLFAWGTHPIDVPPEGAQVTVAVRYFGRRVETARARVPGGTPFLEYKAPLHVFAPGDLGRSATRRGKGLLVALVAVPAVFWLAAAAYVARAISTTLDTAAPVPPAAAPAGPVGVEGLGGGSPSVAPSLQPSQPARSGEGVPVGSGNCAVLGEGTDASYLAAHDGVQNINIRARATSLATTPLVSSCPSAPSMGCSLRLPPRTRTASVASRFR